jgi:high-affinity iron transporter
MNFQTILDRTAVGVAVLLLGATILQAQDDPVRRVANIVSVAVAEYGKGVDALGRRVDAAEQQEAVDFLREARSSAARLTGDQMANARAMLDSLIRAAETARPPQELLAMQQRLAALLGSQAALEVPRHSIDINDGRVLFEKSCASCHGALGKGDGPAAAGIDPKPPAIGEKATMRDVTPAMMYRVASVGISGTQMTGWADVMTPEQRWNVVWYLMTLRRSPAQVAAGEMLFARDLSKLPPEFGSFAWQVEQSDDQLARQLKLGTLGTQLPRGSAFTDDEVENIVAYLRVLPIRAPAARALATDDSADVALVARNVRALLEQSLAAATNGRVSDAGERAFDAYIAFEPLETRARAKNPGLVASAERLFADFKGAVRSGDIRGAERARTAIEADLPAIVELTKPTGSVSDAFWQSFLIILREGFEAILVVGAVVAFLLKTGHRERLRSIWIGAGLGLAASALTALVLETVLAAVPASSEIIEGVTLLVAVAVLFSVSYWLISRVEAAKWQQFIRDKVTAALAQGGGRALAFVAFLAVYREGAETALFYQALFSESGHLALPIVMGIVAGCAALAIIFTLFYRFGVRIPLRPFFSVTSILLYYMAFVFMGKGIRELQEGNVIPISRIHGLPSVEALGIYPTWETVLAQLLLLALLVFALVKTFWPRRSEVL